MNTIAVLLLAAATATGVGLGKPHVGGKKLFRAHAVRHGPLPPGGPIMPAAAGCSFGHPGCLGGDHCPGAMGMGMGPGGMGAAGMGAAGQPGRRFPNTRSQIYFVDPPGMQVGWQTGGGAGADRVYLPAQLTVPARYNFLQGYIYRLKLTEIPARPGLALYPTIEVAPSTPATDAYLSHNPIPVQFTEEDFDQVEAGNFVTKVVYLPDPQYQELAIAGVETLVSTRLEPGVDPILEADRRGTILMILRLGAIDLEMNNAAAAHAPGGPAMGYHGGYDDTVLPPGTLPPGVAPAGPGLNPSVPLDATPNSPMIPETRPFNATPPVPTPPQPHFDPSDFDDLEIPGLDFPDPDDPIAVPSPDF